MELELTHVQITNKNERVEKHGDEYKLAVDINVAATLENVDAFPVGDPDWTVIKEIKLDMDLQGYAVEMHDLYETVTLLGTRLKKFKIEPDGEAYAVSFQIQQSEPHDADLTTLAHWLMSRVEVQIRPESQPALDDGTASDVLDEIEGVGDFAKNGV